MCGPIRSLTENRGFAANAHNLACFGGAGGQHACAVAEALGIKTVLLHKHSSVLSAHGIGLADVVHEAQKPCALIYGTQHLQHLEQEFQALEGEGRSVLATGGVVDEPSFQRYLNLRYDGSDTALMIAVKQGEDVVQSFVDVHHREFGFTPQNRDIFIDNIRVRAISQDIAEERSGFISESRIIQQPKTRPEVAFIKQVFFGTEWETTPVFLLGNLITGMRIPGPALIIDNTQTIVVNIKCEAVILNSMVIINVGAAQKEEVSSTEVDPIQLSVFRHRFFGIAEQMGRVLQKTSVSANIKERLDFSCAIFDPVGNLVANAPHVPAMIGSMGFAVKSQIKKWGSQLQDGDVLLSNSPGERNVFTNQDSKLIINRIWWCSFTRFDSDYTGV